LPFSLIFSGEKSIDTVTPEFAGLTSAEDTGAGGSVLLKWEKAQDVSLPITYKIYYSSVSGNQDFNSENAQTQDTSYTVTGLNNGTAYYFVVRAEDSLGNQDQNTVELKAIPSIQ